MALGEKLGFMFDNNAGREIMSAIFTPKTVGMAVTYKINNTGTTQSSDITTVTFVQTASGVQISSVALEDLIPANAYIRSFEFGATGGGGVFFRLSLAEDGTNDMIIFDEQGLLFIEKLEIIAGGN